VANVPCRSFQVNSVKRMNTVRKRILGPKISHFYAELGYPPESRAPIHVSSRFRVLKEREPMPSPIFPFPTDFADVFNIYETRN